MKKLLTVLMVLIAAVCTALAFGACDLNDLLGASDGGSDGGSFILGDGENDGSSSSNDNGSGGSSSSNGGNNTSSNGGNTSSGGNAAQHTCVFVFTKKVDGCVTNGYDLFTCKEPDCGKTEKHGSYAPVGHDYEHKTFAATCTSNYAEADVCTRCGDEKGKTTTPGTKTAHAYNWTETNAATCTATGLKTGVCADCGATDTEVIPANGHNYGEYVADNNATCVKDGTKTAKCANCTATDVVTDAGTATGVHKYGEYVADNNATCVKDETKTAKCVNCNATDIQTIPDSKSEHDYKWTLKEETCTSETREGVCKNCGVITQSITQYYDAWFRHDFNWTENHNATCTLDGYRSGACRKCGMKHIEFLTATGHKNNGSGKCSVCGENIGIYTEKISLTLDPYGDDGNFDGKGGNLGTLWLELVVTSISKDPVYSGYMAVYDLYIVQQYTQNGNTVTTRKAVVKGYYGRTADIHKVQLWSVTENRNSELECILDYGPITSTGYKGGMAIVRDEERKAYSYIGNFTGSGYESN